VTPEDVRDAARGLQGVAVRTPLVPAPALTEIAGRPVYLKCESLQPVGAFKVRGAYTAVRRLVERSGGTAIPGVITYSSGNHGQAVAFAAQRLQLRAVIVMPETAPQIKIDGVKRWGGEVVLAGRTSEDRKARSDDIAEREGLATIPPFDHLDVIAGQATVGLEIAEQLPEASLVAAPVGGGGLLAGVVVGLETAGVPAAVVGVEPEGAAKLSAALAAGTPVRLVRTGSIADGLLPLSIGAIPFALLMAHRGRFRGAATVADDSIRRAVHLLRDRCRLVAEPSGAATTAALLSGALADGGVGPVVLVVSGGNVDPAFFEAQTGT
jgi:threonine dehydratase